MATIRGLAGAGRAAAIFDLDRTLLPGSSLVYVARAAVRLGLVSPWIVAKGILEDAQFRRRGAASAKVQKLHTRLLKMTAGLELARVEDLVQAVAPRVVADIRPSLRQQVSQHHADGDICIVLSASPDALVAEVARLLGAHLGLGTRVEVVDGRLTGSLEGEACYGSGKLARLFGSGAGVDLTRSFAYADSESDIPLLRAVGHPVAVCPDKGLRAEAEARGWLVIDSGWHQQRAARHRASAA